MGTPGSLSFTKWEPTNGVNSPNAKLTNQQVRWIRMSKQSNAKLAAKYGVSAKSIFNVRNRRTYRDVK